MFTTAKLGFVRKISTETSGMSESGEDQVDLLVTSVPQAVEVLFRSLFVTFPW